MIYMVECSYRDPFSEPAWNDFYSLEKLPALITVAGFYTSQRFVALRPGDPAYLAVHSIADPDVLNGASYRHQGGGHFAQWQRHITDWRRTVYQGLDRAPAIAADELLALSDTGPEPLTRLNLTGHALRAVALDKVPQRRWLARLCGAGRPALDDVPATVQLYRPLTEVLISGGAPVI